MSQENLELFRAYHDAIIRAGREDLDPEGTAAKMATFWHPEVEYDMSELPFPDISGVYRGIETVRELWREWLATWETLQFDYELVDAEDRVVVLLDVKMRGRSSGIEVRLGKAAYVTTFREGLMLHNKFYASQSEALEAVGAPEQPAPAESS